MQEPHPAERLPTVRHLDGRTQRRLLWALCIGIIGVLVIAAAMRALFSQTPAPLPAQPAGGLRPTAEQLRELTISPVRVGATAELLRATGSIAADADHSTPILLPFSGQVTAVLVEAGQRVAAGQPLLRVASPELVDARNTLASTAAQLSAASEAVRVARANATRQRAIYETAGGALKDYNQAQNDLAAAQSTELTAQSAARAARDRLALFGKSPGETRALSGGGAQPATIYRAPVSGLIADRNVAPGQFIAAGSSSTPLMTITNPAHVWLVAQLSESDAAAVKLGDQVTVTTPALPGRAFTATIDNIGAALDPATHRLPVRATVANPGGELKPQMFASFTIRRSLSGDEGLLVPASAVIHEGEGGRVWVLAPNGVLYGRPVATGDTEGGLTRVTRGLRPGDRIVTGGALFVNEAGLNQ